MTGRQGWQPTKMMPCDKCGDPVEVNAQTVNAPTCYNCGMQRAIDAATQMHNKSGPFYDRWLASNARGAVQKGRGTPLDDPTNDPPY